MAFLFGKKHKKSKEDQAQCGFPHDVINLTNYMDEDIMSTDVLGSYTGVPRQNADEEYYETPVQDADDL